MTHAQVTPDTILARLRSIDDALGAAGFPQIHDWWWRTITRFLRSGKRQLVVRKGRRVGGSTIVGPRLAIAFGLSLAHVVPKGEVGVVAFLSVKRDEAANRLRNIRAGLDALGIAHHPGPDGSIELEAYPVQFKVLTASYRLTVGELVLFAWLDELSRWRDEITGENPASETVASLKPSLATIAEARMFLVSSPLSTVDFHAKTFDAGDTDAQMVAHCTSWEAGPLTKQQTKELESDPRIWAREYAAEPVASVSAGFDPEDIARCTEHGVRSRPFVAGTQYACVADLGGLGGVSDAGRSDSAMAIAHVEYQQNGEGAAVLKVLTIDRVRIFRRSFLKKVNIDLVTKALIELAREFHVGKVSTDMHLAAAVAPQLQQNGIAHSQLSMTLSDQAKRSSSLISMVTASAISLLDDPDLLRQLREAVLRLRGTESFILTRPSKTGAKDDLLDCILGLVEVQGSLQPSGNAGIRKSPARVAFIEGRLVETRPEIFYRIGPNGTAIPVDTPRDGVNYRRNQLERWSKGITTPADLREFGSDEALQAAMQEALHAAATVEYGDLVDSEIEFPQSPEEEMLGVRLARLGPNRNVQ